MKRENSEHKNNESSQESIMNHVNQTFEEMVQDVKNLVNENSQKNNDNNNK